MIRKPDKGLLPTSRETVADLRKFHGFDDRVRLGTGAHFWKLPSDAFQVCSACYQGEDLLTSADNYITRLSKNGSFQMKLHGRYEALAHGIHLIDESVFGVVDTGNSQLVIVSRDGQLSSLLRPLEAWGEIVPQDAIHLNDFVVTPHGILASCFGYRPWRKLLESVKWESWCTSGYGLILNLTGKDERGAGRIVGCGFSHPHSLHYTTPNLYVCSSGTGVFHICELDHAGLVRERRQWKVTNNHFLRGAYQGEKGWYLGGSSLRCSSTPPEEIEIYLLDEVSGIIHTQRLGWVGEVYDILPWRDELLRPIIAQNFPQYPA